MSQRRRVRRGKKRGRDEDGADKMDLEPMEEIVMGDEDDEGGSSEDLEAEMDMPDLDKVVSAKKQKKVIQIDAQVLWCTVHVQSHVHKHQQHNCDMDSYSEVVLYVPQQKRVMDPGERYSYEELDKAMENDSASQSAGEGSSICDEDDVFDDINSSDSLGGYHDLQADIYAPLFAHLMEYKDLVGHDLL